MRSSPRSSAGPEVLLSPLPISLARMIGQRRLAEPGRPVEQHVVQALAALPGRLDRDPQALDRLALPDVLVQALGTQRALERRLVGEGRSGSAGSRSRRLLGGRGRSPRTGPRARRCRAAGRARHGSPGPPRPGAAPSAGPGCRAPATPTSSAASSRGGRGGASTRGSSAYFATLPSSWATMLRHFCGPMPGSRRRKRSSFRTIASAMSAIGRTSARAATSGPDVLDGDEPLEELALHVLGESDQDGAGLIARGVVVDDQLQLGPVDPVARRQAVQPAGDHRRQHHLVPHAGRLDDDAAFQPPAQPAAQRGDHRAPSPRARDRPV